MDDDDLDLSTEGGRLKWARQRVFPKAKDFAKLMKMREVTYRAYENNQNKYAKHAPDFARFLNVSTDWLLKGGPLPDSAAPEPPPPGELGTPDTLADFDIELIRQVDLSLAMGPGAELEDYPDYTFLPFDRNQLRKITRASPEHLSIITGHGESMEPTLLRSDAIMVDRSQRQVFHSDFIWAFAYGGSGMIKRLRRLPNDRFRIISDNPSVPDEEAAAEDIHIFGKVVWVARNMT